MCSTKDYTIFILFYEWVDDLKPATPERHRLLKFCKVIKKYFYFTDIKIFVSFQKIAVKFREIQLEHIK